MAGKKAKVIFFGLLFLVFVFSLIGLGQISAPAYAAACSATGGTVTYSINIEADGNYNFWARMQTSGNSNGFYAEIDGQQCLLIGDSSAISSSSWAWVNYVNGNSAQKAQINLSKGNHTIRLIGHEVGLKLDKFILTSDASCVPEGLGDNCVSSGPEPSKLGDINIDSKVDIFDLSILLSKWQVQSTNEPADLNNDNVINIFDLSTLLSRWGS